MDGAEVGAVSDQSVEQVVTQLCLAEADGECLQGGENGHQGVKNRNVDV